MTVEDKLSEELPFLSRKPMIFLVGSIEESGFKIIEDQWGKEETSRERLKKSLYDLADKQRKAITEWEECHPDWESSEQGKQEWILLVKNVMGTLEENAFSENKIIKNIAREVKI